MINANMEHYMAREITMRGIVILFIFNL